MFFVKKCFCETFLMKTNNVMKASWTSKSPRPSTTCCLRRRPTSTASCTMGSVPATTDFQNVVVAEKKDFANIERTKGKNKWWLSGGGMGHGGSGEGEWHWPATCTRRRRPTATTTKKAVDNDKKPKYQQDHHHHQLWKQQQGRPSPQRRGTVSAGQPWTKICTRIKRLLLPLELTAEENGGSVSCSNSSVVVVVVMVAVAAQNEKNMKGVVDNVLHKVVAAAAGWDGNEGEGERRHQ